MSDTSVIIGSMDDGIGAKLTKALENGLLIAYRVKNHKLDYSIMNRPEPTLSGVDDHALATAIVYAGNKFKLVVDPDTAGGRKSEKVSRDDGRTIAYDEFIDIDWAENAIRTTRRSTMTFTVLQGVVGELMRTAKAPTPAAAPQSPN